jgi:hypothetical protein
MGGFLSSILTGSDPTLDGDIGNAGNINGFGTAVGEGDISAASGFYNDLLSGNQAKEAQLLAPEIGTIQSEGQQANQTAAQFHNRSGGTNASAQQNMDKQRSSVNDMIAKLTGGAASGLANIGENALSTGLRANEVQSGETQQKQKNRQGSLLSGIINGAADAGLDYATGGLAAAGGGGGGEAQSWAPPGFLSATGNGLGLATDDELGDVSF